MRPGRNRTDVSTAVPREALMLGFGLGCLSFREHMLQATGQGYPLFVGKGGGRLSWRLWGMSTL